MEYPYPSREIKEQIAKKAKISIFKLDKWLQNEKINKNEARRNLQFLALQLKIDYLKNFL